MEQQRYMPRFPDAREYLRAKGIDTGKNGLKDMASRDTGPRYAIINGRAVYTAEWLDAWVDSQAARPVPRRALRDAAMHPSP